MKDIDLVLSSNPPESVHIASLLLSKKYAVPLIIDMRDGWLDEPLKPIIEQIWLRKFLEGILEKKVLTRADHIFVTSTIWKEKLIERYPFLSENITVLTNGYPNMHDRLLQQKVTASHHHITLVHAGQFSASHMKRKVSYLLGPVLDTAKQLNSRIKGKIILLGYLGSRDQDDVEVWKKRFEEFNWELVTMSYIPRDEMFLLLQQANGLMLLEVKSSGIPSKLFEYIPTGKPVLALTPRGSAVWEICKTIPQIFLKDCFNKYEEEHNVIEQFLQACDTGEYRVTVPKEFAEEHLSSVFLDSIEKSVVHNIEALQHPK